MDQSAASNMITLGRARLSDGRPLRVSIQARPDSLLHTTMHTGFVNVNGSLQVDGAKMMQLWEVVAQPSNGSRGEPPGIGLQSFIFNRLNALMERVSKPQRSKDSVVEN